MMSFALESSLDPYSGERGEVEFLLKGASQHDRRRNYRTRFLARTKSSLPWRRSMEFFHRPQNKN